MRQRSLGWTVAAALGIFVACGGSTAAVPGGGGGGGDAGATSGGPATDGGGTTTDGGGTTFDAATRPDAGPKGACQSAPDCNEDPMMSALAGSCYVSMGFGVCSCNAGFHIQPDGKCGSAPSPRCMDMGGQCVQDASNCPAGKVPGSDEANMSCGDLVAAACCFEAAQCVGPTFGCCGPTDASHAPICESGHLTCPPGYSPSAGPCG